MRKVVYLNVIGVCSISFLVFIQQTTERGKLSSLIRPSQYLHNSYTNRTRPFILLNKANTTFTNGSIHGACVPESLPKMSPRGPRFAVDLMSLGPFEFLDNFRNPCFKQTNRIIRCLPYYYLIGTPKSGTTDLARRIARHPEVSAKVPKEPHWLTRYRFNKKNYRRALTAFPKFTQYLDVFKRATLDINVNTLNGTFHPKVVGDCSASTSFDNTNWQLLRENVNRTEPLYTNADVIYHLNPKAKIIAILRNPVDRWYSDYLFFKYYGQKSPENFHKLVQSAMKNYEKCFSRCSYRHCLSRQDLEKAEFRAYIGLYYYHLKEFYRVFPKDQILVLMMEEYAENRIAHLTKIYEFLELAPLTQTQLEAVLKDDEIYNLNKKKISYGKMLNETRTILENFYKPHNEKLEQFLGRSLWKMDT